MHQLSMPTVTAGAMIQAVSVRSLTAEVSVRYLTSSSEMSLGQVLGFSPVSITASMIHIRLLIYHRRCITSATDSVVK